MSSLLSFDYKITAWLQNIFPHNDFFNIFFNFFSVRGGSIIIWLIVILTVLLIEEVKNPGISKRDLRFIFYFFMTFSISFLLSETVLKNFFLRPRPDLNILLSCPTDFSFPSSHATTAFASSTILSFFDKKKRWLYHLVAFIISYSRIYLGCHYLLDVIFGGILGIIVGKIILKSKIWR